MSGGKLIGYRVLTGAAKDTFELREAAEQCVRILRAAKVPASLHEVLELAGIERSREIKVRPVKREKK